MGGCEVRDLPQVENSRRILVKPFRGNVVKYKCRTHYRLFGQNMFHCADGGKWGGGEAPVCTRKFCWKKFTFPFLYHYSRNFQNFDQKIWGPPFFHVHQYNFNSNIYRMRRQLGVIIFGLNLKNPAMVKCVMKYATQFTHIRFGLESVKDAFWSE